MGNRSAQDELRLKKRGALIIAEQGSRFIGGEDLANQMLRAAKSAAAAFIGSGTITTGQIYVRHQIPVEARQSSIVLVHGGSLTGACWETTPDGRQGWDEYFLRRGFSTYVIDQVARGRSACNASEINAVRDGDLEPAALPTIFTLARESAWATFRLGPDVGARHPGVRFPIEAAADLWRQVVPDWSLSLPQPNPTIAGLARLTSEVGPGVLIGHSQSGGFPFLVAERAESRVSAIVSIEPAACPDIDDAAGVYDGLPILFLYGDYIRESDFWRPRLEECERFVERLNVAGARAQIIILSERGLPGHTHLMMQDLGNLEIADLIVDWLDRNAVT
jgi:pimeloyl-ACP methyl ester carboxylesterase